MRAPLKNGRGVRHMGTLRSLGKWGHEFYTRSFPPQRKGQHVGKGQAWVVPSLSL